MCEDGFESPHELNKHQEEMHKIKDDASEDYVLKGYPEREETEEDILLNNFFGGMKKETPQEGITMKGKSKAFKDACILVKT